MSIGLLVLGVTLLAIAWALLTDQRPAKPSIARRPSDSNARDADQPGARDG